MRRNMYSTRGATGFHPAPWTQASHDPAIDEINRRLDALESSRTPQQQPDPVVVFDRRHSAGMDSVSHPLDPELAAALAAGGGWVFSAEVDPASLSGLISAHGIAGPPDAKDDNAAQAAQAAADEAFARMVAANPGAKVVGEPDFAQSNPVSAQTETECVANTQCILEQNAQAADEAFAQMVAANPSATVFVGCGDATEEINPVAFQADQANTQCILEQNAQAADEAFARMVAANPRATIF